MEQSAVDALLGWQSALRLNAVAEKLRKRGYDVAVCATRDEARTRLLSSPKRLRASALAVRSRWPA